MSQPCGERGQVLPLLAAAMAAMLIMVGVVVDGGNGFQNKQAVQNAADAAAIAAALEVANGNCTSSDPAACGVTAGMYAGLNGANGTDGNSSAPTPLHACTPTTPPDRQPVNTPCYIYPYVDKHGEEHAEQVAVWLNRTSENYFGRLLGFLTSSESARAVASLGPAPAPEINFASLFKGCDNHSLLIKAGGILTVNQAIYVNSCNVPKDAFGVFGGGSIKAPSIHVVGGWETHNNSTVWTTGPSQTWPEITQCLPSIDNPNSGPYYDVATGTFRPMPAGCPLDGVPSLVDPFRTLPAPAVPAIARGVSTFVTHKGRQSKIATLVTDPALPVYQGSTVRVDGMDDPSFDTLAAQVTSSSGNVFSYANEGSDVPPAAVAHADVTSGGLRNYIVTLHLSSGVSLCVGDAITVQNVDAAANGTFAVLSVNGAGSGCNSSTTTLTYKDTNAAASRTYQKGGPAGTPTFTAETLSGCRSASTCTATIGGLSVAASVHAGDDIDVSNATEEPTFDGSYEITADSTGNSVSYRPVPFVMIFERDSIANGVATLRIQGPTDPPASLANGAKATIAVASNLPGPDPRFDGTYTVKTSCPVVGAGCPTADTVTYDLTDASFSGWSVSAGIVTLKGTNVPTGLQAGDTITPHFNGAGVPGCVSKAPATVVSSSSTQVVYTVAQTPCANASGSQTGTITIASVSAQYVGGTAQVVSNDAAPANGSIVVVPVDRTFGAVGSVSVLTVPAATGFATLLNAGTPANPTPYQVASGTSTLNPGTYYGGIFIGAPTGKLPTSATCTNTVPSSAHVTLNPGIYYIAGGGFHVCGGSTLYAPHVLIYNTQDAGNTTTTYGKLGQVQINTTGQVTLGPQDEGLYSGLTIFQDRNLILTRNGPAPNGDNCNAKSGKPAEWDIALQSMADPGPPNHALGGITGTVYAPGEYTTGSPPKGTGADFGLKVSGTTTLAVFTSCIYIEGVDDTFNYSSSPPDLFGLGATLSG